MPAIASTDKPTANRTGAFSILAYSGRMAETAGGEKEPRGFALYVGLGPETSASEGVDLPGLVTVLRDALAAVAPSAKTHATIALAPAGLEGDDLEIVRLALHDPGRLRAMEVSSAAQPAREGVTIDISRKRVTIGSGVPTLTYREFALLQFLVLREGQTVPREAIIEHLWTQEDSDIPNVRTIDVHIRRLRSKLVPYEDIIRTVRGLGYRFDRHADVRVVYGHGPSPDVGV